MNRNISISFLIDRDIKKICDSKIASGKYANFSEYIRYLINKDINEDEEITNVLNGKNIDKHINDIMNNLEHINERHELGLQCNYVTNKLVLRILALLLSQDFKPYEEGVKEALKINTQVKSETYQELK